MKIIAICSGGLDSTVMFYKLIADGHEVIAVNFSYGSRHNAAERERARLLIPNIREINIDLSFLKSSLLSGASQQAVPHGHYEEENMKSTVVPFRNGIMLSYAIAIAEDLKFDAVALGSHAGDHAIYPDCRIPFTQAISKAAEEGTYGKIKIISPFNALSKGEIAAVGKDLEIDNIMMTTWSCYEGKEVHCGKCGACTERKEAFAYAGLEDTTTYRREIK